MYNPEVTLRRARRSSARRRQRGVSLIEMLVGLTIGLLVIAAAIGTMVLSRSTAALVSDLSQLQQQGSYALRVIGMQVRQAGSLELIQTPGLTTVSFNAAFTGVKGSGTVATGIEGADGAPDTVSFSNQPSTTLTTTQSRDCLGNTIPATLTGIRMDSTFSVSGSELRCLGVSATPQPLIGNVADFQVWYRVKTSDTGIQRLNADEVTVATLWDSVRSVEICLDMQGNETGNPASGTYANCNGATTQRNGRIHLLFRNVFDFRTQGS